MATQGKQSRDRNATLIKAARGWEITLPMDIREQMGLALAGHLKAQAIDGATYLKPVKLVSSADADQKLEQSLSQVKYTGPEPMPSVDELAGDVAEIIHDMRRDNAESGTR